MTVLLVLSFIIGALLIDVIVHKASWSHKTQTLSDVLYDTDLPEVGFTMADGGEKIDSIKKDKK